MLKFLLFSWGHRRFKNNKSIKQILFLNALLVYWILNCFVFSKMTQVVTSCCYSVKVGVWATRTIFRTSRDIQSCYYSEIGTLSTPCSDLSRDESNLRHSLEELRKRRRNRPKRNFWFPSHMVGSVTSKIQCHSNSVVQRDRGKPGQLNYQIVFWLSTFQTFQSMKRNHVVVYKNRDICSGIYSVIRNRQLTETGI